ncbi:MAG: ATP synthase subunit I [Burkholderiales bacterium]|nr:ATP synthase subunit I [Burkholderiales bacterium]
MSSRPVIKTGPSDRWRDPQDEAADPPTRKLSREDVALLRMRQPSVPPWWVVGCQAAVGVVTALIGWLVMGRNDIAWSLLYGAAVVVVPAGLKARGIGRRPADASPGASAVSFMMWELVIIVVSVAMLAVANRIVRPLVWPALLVGLVACFMVYWVALLWRREKKQ